MLLTSLLASAGLVLATPRQWPLWATAIAGLIPLVPVFVVGARWNLLRHHWLVLFYVLLVTQSGHFLEHVAQMIQIHVLGLQGAAAQGIFGALNIEWVHFIWNIWVVVAAIALVIRFRDNPWLWFTTLFAGWHAIEHSYILWVYLQTRVAGTPGLLSLGGVIHGGLPLVRPDLHFLYNLIETVPLVFAFFWQVRRMPTRATAMQPTHLHTKRTLSLPAFIVPTSVMTLFGVAIAASFSGPVKNVVTPDGELVCDRFYALVHDVRAQVIPVAEIRSTLDDIAVRTPRADYNLQPALPGFVHAAREAVASYSTYPTFDLMAYSETYAHMEPHAHTQEAIARLSKACAANGYTAKPRPARSTELASQPALARTRDAQAGPASDAVVKNPQLATAAVQSYLGTKPWGFFGATCGRWVSMHYQPDQADATYMAHDDEWVVVIPRVAEALGPTLISYHVNAHTGLTYGDPANNTDSQFAEGCDKY
jgi:hypothetical protein